MKNTDYYTYKNGDIFPISKKEIYSVINETNPESFLWVLEALDIPYIEEEWFLVLKRWVDKQAINEFLPQCEESYILGRYIAKMKLKGYKGFHFKDSDSLNNIMREEREHRKKIKQINDFMKKEREY